MRSVLLCLFLLLPGHVPAAEPVSLPEALRAAVRCRPTVRAALQEAAAAEATVGAARGRLLPRLTLRETFTATDEPATSLFLALNQQQLEVRQDADFYNFPGTHRDFETRLSLEQPLFEPALYWRWRQAEAGAEAAAASADWSAEQAAFAAFRAYLEVQQAHAALAWVQSSRREAAEILRIGEERHRAGLGLQADVLRARVFQAEVERWEVSAANDLLIARRALALAMGREGEIEIAAPLLPGELQTAMKGSSLRRPDLAALAARQQQAELAYRQSRAAWLPRLGLSAAYVLHDERTPFGTEADSWMIGAVLTWDLFTGLERGYSARAAAATAQAAAEHRQEGWRQARFQLQEARARSEEARLHLLSAREAERQAKESHRLMLQRFEAGLSNLSDQLSAQSALDRTRFDATLAEGRYILSLGSILFQGGVFRQLLLPPAEEILP